MNLHRRYLLGLVAAAFLLTLGGLIGCGNSPATPGTGTLSVHFDFDNAAPSAAALRARLDTLDDGLIPSGRTPLADLILTITSVEAWSCTGEDDTTSVEDSLDVAVRLSPLHDGDGDDDEYEHEDDDFDCFSTVVLADTSITLSAAGLDTSLTAYLGSVELLEGEYHHLTLGISGAWVVTAAGDTVEASLPGDKDHLKVNSPFTVSEGGVTDVVIVFNVHRSVVENPPGSMNFKVKPVLHSHQGWYDHEDHDEDDELED